MKRRCFAFICLFTFASACYDFTIYPRKDAGLKDKRAKDGGGAGGVSESIGTTSGASRSVGTVIDASNDATADAQFSSGSAGANAGVTGTSAGGGVGGSIASGDSGVVGARNPLGAACKEFTDCDSQAHACVDNVCCESHICGECQNCGTSGRCESITSGQDWNSCFTPNVTCNPAGKCALRIGANCEVSDQPCLTGSCVDGRCCESTSCGICSSCAVAGKEGQCFIISGLDDPNSCNGNESCHKGQCVTVDAQSAQANGGPYFGNGDGVFYRLAQTVTISNSGSLVEVRLEINCSLDTDPYNVFIYDVVSDGTPGTRMLAVAQPDTTPTPPKSRPPDGIAFFAAFVLSSPLPVSSGEQVAIVVEAPNSKKSCLLQWSKTSNAYSGGIGYGLADAQSSWNEIRADFAFQTLVAP